MAGSFFQEQPHPSELYHEEPWEEVRRMPGVVSIVIDQCRTELRARDGGYVRKPTELLANAVELLKPFV